MSSPDPHPDRLDSLRASGTKLKGAPPAELLRTAGALLRRLSAARVDPAPLEEALRGLPGEALREAVEGLDLAELEQTLARAAEEAVEAALSEDPEEQELWSGAALEALQRRDEVESTRFAVARWHSLGGSPDPRTHRALQKLQTALDKLDRTFRAKARWFTPLNPERRIERELLDASHRDSAWWFSSRSGCDELIAKLSGQTSLDERHFKSCADCRRDLGSSSTVDAPPRPHLTEEDLWSYDLGLMSLSERRSVVTHADECLECAQLIHAISEGEKAIAETAEWELERARAERTRHGPAPTEGYASTRRPGKHLVAAQNEFRVVLVRDARRVRLVVQPLTGRGLAAAAVSLLPRRPIEPLPTAEGLEFELGESGPLMGKVVRVRVRVKPDSTPFERDIDL